MTWLELHIDTNHAGLDAVEILLSSLGIDGLVIDDEAEFQDFLENNRQYWDYVDEELEQSMRGKSRVTFYLPADETGFSKMAEVRIALAKLKQERDDCGSLLMTLEDLEDADWENNWKQYYKMSRITRPSRCLFFGESGHATSPIVERGGSSYMNYPTAFFSGTYELYPRHGEQLNIIFTDGHVQTFAYTYVRNNISLARGGGYPWWGHKMEALQE